MKEVKEKEPVSAPRKGPITVKLSDPIQWGSETIKEVELTAVKGKHLRKLSANPTLNDLMNIASKVSGLSSAVFDEMSSEDVMKVADAVGELL